MFKLEPGEEISDMKFTMGDTYKYHDTEDQSEGGDSGKEGRVGVGGGDG